jgi:nucleotide-binding universal stress UspA family protein
VPAAVQPSALERVAVAWDGSREAVRAVHDALPLLGLARSVQIATMIDSATAAEADQESLSARLAHHGIDVGANVFQIRSAEEHSSLRKPIEQGQYDLLVMGGYSHSTWFDFIFGGATNSIISTSRIPVLISH